MSADRRLGKGDKTGRGAGHPPGNNNGNHRSTTPTGNPSRNTARCPSETNHPRSTNPATTSRAARSRYPVKSGYKTCQFLTPDRLCGVYEARPHDCRGYVCWNQEDGTFYDYAVFLQVPVKAPRVREKDLKK